MAKKAITFLAGWSRYNAGETAAFEAKQADDLINQGIAKLAPTQPTPDIMTVSLGIDPRETEAFKEASAEIVRAAQEVRDGEAALGRREADLAARATALDEREAALADREKALEASAPVEREKPDDTANDKDAGATQERQPEPAAKSTGLPKQGR